MNPYGHTLDRPNNPREMLPPPLQLPAPHTRPTVARLLCLHKELLHRNFAGLDRLGRRELHVRRRLDRPGDNTSDTKLVYSYTAAQLARAYPSVFAPLAIPPHSMMGIDAGSSGRSARSIASVYDFSGAPEGPQVST